MPYEPPPELAGLSLSEIAALVAARRLPPLERWAPTQILDSQMRIAADGRWFHRGAPISRPAMVRAFSSLLTCDADGRHWLVTPEDKQSIVVDDAAFIAVDVREDDGVLAFRLNTDEFVICGPDHPLTARGTLAEPAIYLGVRHGCQARLNRSTWLQLAQIARSERPDGSDATVTSQGAKFALCPA